MSKPVIRCARDGDEVEWLGDVASAVFTRTENELAQARHDLAAAEWERDRWRGAYREVYGYWDDTVTEKRRLTDALAAAEAERDAVLATWHAEGPAFRRRAEAADTPTPCGCGGSAGGYRSPSGGSPACWARRPWARSSGRGWRKGLSGDG